MVKVCDITTAIDTFVDSRIDIVIGNNPLMSLIQPFIKRAVKMQVNNYTEKLECYLKLLADKDGNIDIDNIFDEVLSRFNSMDSITIPTESIGNIALGKGKLSIDLPSIFGTKSKSLVFTADDISDFKSMIINKNGNN